MNLFGTHSLDGMLARAVAANPPLFLTKVTNKPSFDGLRKAADENTLANGAMPGAATKAVEIAGFVFYSHKISKEPSLTPIPPIALTIAGFDPGSGAGITADLKTFSAHGIYGVACITALTVQSSQGVRLVESLSPLLFRNTLDCLMDDLTLSGVKIGMLGTAAVARQVASFLSAQAGAIPPQRVVLDPVLRSSSGARLLDPEGLVVLREELLAHAGWVTPNIDELALLTGKPVGRHEIPAAATHLQELAARAGNPGLQVVVTGGHLDPPDDFLLTAEGEAIWLQGERIVTNSTHGTGCAFSSALVSALISGRQPRQAVAAAKAYVTEALRSAYPVGKGKGPMNHLFRLPTL